MKILLKFWYAPVIAFLLLSNFKSYIDYSEISKKLAIYNREDSLIRKQVQTSAAIISRKIGKFGLKHVTLTEGGGILSQELVNVVAVSAGILDTTAMALDILKNKIEYITGINNTLEAKNISVEKHLDSLKREIYSYNDKFVSLKIKPSDTLNKPSSLDFKYNAKLTYVQEFRKRFPLIGAKRSYINIWSDDPRTTINGTNRLEIEQREPQFGLRIQLRSIYSLTSQKMFIGPGLSFDLKRYNLLGYSYYSISDRRWIYAVGVNYDLIRF